MTEAAHGLEPPSPWVRRWSHLVPAGGTVLDLACGHGRHARWFHKQNHPVALVDRAQEAIDFVASRLATGNCEAVVADIENGPWPFPGRQFAAIVVTNYLWRPLFPVLLGSLAMGGVLIYETFSAGNETVGKPSRPDFLLRPGELLALCHDLRIVAFEDGFLDETPSHRARFVQRIAAVREAPGQSPSRSPARYPLAESEIALGRMRS